MKLGSSKAMTLVELMIATVIFVIVTISVIGLWMHTSTQWRRQNKNTLMRMDMIKALETIRAEIRLSSMDIKSKMLFYPDGAGPYKAVSFPLGVKDPNGLFEVDESGIIARKTVIYHLFDENEDLTVRRTVIDPRDNSLSIEEQRSLLETVFSSGTGPSGSHTQKRFLTNVEAFEIRSVSSGFDFYTDSSEPERKWIDFGGIVLEPGEQEIRFEITGRNENSSGYSIGLDNIFIEPAGASREMEFFIHDDASGKIFGLSGGNLIRVNDSVWSNNNYLEFNVNGREGSYFEFSDHWDLWRESSFSDSRLDNLTRTGSWNHIEVDLPELGSGASTSSEQSSSIGSWYASDQTGSSADSAYLSDEVSAFENFPYNTDDTVYVCIRSVIDSEHLSFSNEESGQDLLRVFFKAGNSDLNIKAAYFTARQGTDGAIGFENLVPSSVGEDAEPEDYHYHQKLFFRDASGNLRAQTEILSREGLWSEWTAFPVVKGTDHFVTIVLEVQDQDAFNAIKFDNSNANERYSFFKVFNSEEKAIKAAGTPSSFIYSDLAVDWSLSEVDGHYSEHSWVVKKIDTASDSGNVTSRIFDTQADSPQFDKIKWSENATEQTDFKIKVLSGDSEDDLRTVDWDTAPIYMENPSELDIGNDRFLRFKGFLRSHIFWMSPAGGMLEYKDYINEQVSSDKPYIFPIDPLSGKYFQTKAESPEIDNISISWFTSGPRFCRLTGYIAKRDDYGMAKITVNGRELTGAINIYAKLKGLVGDNEVTQEAAITVQPRNTGRFSKLVER